MTQTARLVKIERALAPTGGPFFPEYRGRPVDFARDVLRVTWTPRQCEIALAAERPPYRVLVKSSHNVGKTMFSAGYAAYFFLTRKPAIVITTAPKMEQVRDLLWKEIRTQARHLLPFAGTRGPRVDRAADDFMVGTTAQTGTGFQGHHGPHMLFVFDEAVGVEPEFWEVAQTMFCPPGHAWICIFNPTDSASAAYQAEMARGADGAATWTVITMSSLEHPNILAELRGEPPPIPSAIRLGRLNDMLAEWCEGVTGLPDEASDIQWPPASGKWVRPGPLAEARLLGRWPSSAAGVWSDALWRAALREPPAPDPKWPVVLGCDVARFGDDYTVIHVRHGPVSLHHEWHNGWSAAQTCGRLKELCREWAAWLTRLRPAKAAKVLPESIPVNVDDDGIGGAGIVDHAEGYAFRGVSAARASTVPDDYPNLRSELWFAAAARARAGQLFLGKLPQAAQDRLRRELLAPTYRLDAAGRRVVEPKDATKENLGYSPDSADALNLAYHEAPSTTPQAHEPTGPRPEPRRLKDRPASGHFGRGR